MEKTFIFSIAVVFCVGIFITSAEKVSGNDLIISQNHTSVDTAVNKEFYFNASELKVAQADECECENGQCIRECDVDKTKPCDDQKQVCVCPQEFAREYWVEDECRFCNCGFGINCTFNYLDSRGRRAAKCTCPEGYFTEYYPDKTECLTVCSDRRPCLNGGRCLSGKCYCSGGTGGDLCKEISECKHKCLNRLEVSCLYNDRYDVAYCNCKNNSLYFDQEANICKPCPCGENGFCDYDYDYNNRRLVCKCKYGYKLFNGYCKKCDCDLGTKSECEFDSEGNKICNCADGYYEREGRCSYCGCTRYGDLDTRCKVTGNVKRCFCKLGFEDVDGFCEDINECEGDHLCHPSATCFNTFGSYECRCADGYGGRNGAIVGPREACEDINECQELSQPCYYWNNVECVNLPGSYKCECLPGYQPRSFSDEPRATTCFTATKSITPSVIATGTALALIVVSCVMHILVKKRATRSN